MPKDDDEFSMGSRQHSFFPVPEREEERLAFLRSLNVLDTPPDNLFTDLVEMASIVMGSPVALLNLVDGDRVWSKAKKGIEIAEVPREFSVCSHTILNRSGEPLVIEDFQNDVRFATNPILMAHPEFRSYAGFPIVLFDAYNVGALCTLDRVPKMPSKEQLAHLKTLTDFAVKRLEALPVEVRSRALMMFLK